MNHRTHLAVTLISRILGFLAVMGAFAIAIPRLGAEAMAEGYGVVVACFVAMPLCVLVPWVLLRFLIPARCAECGGKSYYTTRSGRVRYECRECGDVVRTRVFTSRSEAKRCARRTGQE